MKTYNLKDIEKRMNKDDIAISDNPTWNGIYKIYLNLANMV